MSTFVIGLYLVVAFGQPASRCNALRVQSVTPSCRSDSCMPVAAFASSQKDTCTDQQQQDTCTDQQQQQVITSLMSPSDTSDLPPRPTLRMPEQINIPILYESDRVLAINKPHGVSHHDDLNTGMPGILSIFRHLQQIDTASRNSIAYKGRIYGVHRLDRATSGIVLLAKDKETAGLLTKAFRDKEVVKYYFGISAKKPQKKKQGWVKGDMVKGRRGAWILQKTMEDPAVTRFFTAGLGGMKDHLVRELAGNRDRPVPRTAILFRPHTGRTHQLRVAAKSIGLPLMFDPYYGDGTASKGRDEWDGAACIGMPIVERTYLHATALHVNLGAGKEDITIWCPPPFGGLWEGGNQHGFDDIVSTMVQKHCDDNEILLRVEHLRG